jgi:hypothetical protein
VRPSPGRIVHYVPDEHAVVLPDRCQAAIVTAAGDPGGEVVLAVFAPGVTRHVFGSAHDEEAKAPGTWHWPERTGG